jgi:hypothetical protein
MSQSLIDLAKSHVKAGTAVTIAEQPTETPANPEELPQKGVEGSAGEGDTVDVSIAQNAEGAVAEILDPAVLACRKQRGERLLKAMGAR